LQILESIQKLVMGLVLSIVHGGRAHGAGEVWP
jgi:hypothetical protein